MANEQHVLLFSGGLDSYLAYLALKDNGINPQLVYCNLGHRYRHQELTTLTKLVDSYSSFVVDRSLDLGRWEREDAFIPNRNGFLAMIGSLYGNRIWMAIMEGEQTYNDCKPETFTALSVALSQLKGETVVVDSPFWHMTKAEVIAALDPKYYDNLKLTTSCHNAHKYPYHCGNCGACFRRWVAFTVNGIEDKFVVNPWETSLAEEYLHKAVNTSIYGPKRSREIVLAFEKVGISC